MPFSSDSGKALVDRAIQRLTKRYGDVFFRTGQIVDIGAGSGTYSKRYRKTTDLGGAMWTGVEIWEPYVEKYELQQHYDVVAVSSGIDFFKGRFVPDQSFDICFMGDVVEHMTKEEAIELIQLGIQKSRLVIVSIPIVHYPQDEYDGNPYEKHVKDDWSHEEVMASLPGIAWYGVEKEIGVYFCTLEPLLIQQALAPLIAVYAICKDEVKFIPAFYESIKNADIITICDTGSTDGTFELLQDYVEDRVHEYGHEEELSRDMLGATDGAMTVARICISPWRFDDARNVALSLIPSDVDMCISIDVDERLQADWKELLTFEILDDLRTKGKVADRYNHRFQTIWDWDGAGTNKTSHWHERIHSRHGFRWKLPVHEILYKADESHFRKWLGGWWMTQYPDTSKSRSSYLDLLKISVNEDPSVWKSWSFYGTELLNAGRFDEAYEAFHKGCAAPDSDKVFLTMQTARVLAARGEYVHAGERMEETANKDRSLREPLVYASDYFLLAGDRDRAARCLLNALQRTRPASSYHHDESCWGEGMKSRTKALGIHI